MLRILWGHEVAKGLSLSHRWGDLPKICQKEISNFVHERSLCYAKGFDSTWRQVGSCFACQSGEMEGLVGGIQKAECRHEHEKSWHHDIEDCAPAEPLSGYGIKNLHIISFCAIFKECSEIIHIVLHDKRTLPVTWTTKAFPECEIMGCVYSTSWGDRTILKVLKNIRLGQCKILPDG